MIKRLLASLVLVMALVPSISSALTYTYQNTSTLVNVSTQNVNGRYYQVSKYRTPVYKTVCDTYYYDYYGYYDNYVPRNNCYQQVSYKTTYNKKLIRNYNNSYTYSNSYSYPTYSYTNSYANNYYNNYAYTTGYYPGYNYYSF